MNAERYQQIVENWLNEIPDERHTRAEKGSTDFTFVKRTEIDQWFSTWLQQLPESQKRTMMEGLDQLLLYLTRFFQRTSRCQTIENNILRQARLFQEQLTTIEDMRHLKFHQLEYMEEQFKQKYAAYALVQGGLAGLGRPIFLLLDFPALLTINLNVVQYIAGVYGHSLKNPGEQILALKVLHAASLPKTYRRPAWEWLMDQYDRENDLNLYVQENGTMIQPEWLETIAKQCVKTMLLYGMNKTTRKNFSLLGIALGANSNYRFTKQVGEFVSHFYRYRHLAEKV